VNPPTTPATKQSRKMLQPKDIDGRVLRVTPAGARLGQ